ncbi:MAG: hypothetical protein H0T51_23230 [Pirellulales bacterium]|nr:hypothetical protein [Pirellulales bacterium]
MRRIERIHEQIHVRQIIDAVQIQIASIVRQSRRQPGQIRLRPRDGGRPIGGVERPVVIDVADTTCASTLSAS